jgi:hypothetical protein
VSTEKEEPLDQYREQTDSGVFSTLPYDRLMIHYRKLKQYDEELRILKKGIETFRKFYKEMQGDVLKGKINPKIRTLSKKISQSTGLTDKKGIEAYLPEPLPRWIKRESVVQQKIKKKKAK